MQLIMWLLLKEEVQMEASFVKKQQFGVIFDFFNLKFSELVRKIKVLQTLRFFTIRTSSKLY